MWTCSCLVLLVDQEATTCWLVPLLLLPFSFESNYFAFVSTFAQGERNSMGLLLRERGMLASTNAALDEVMGTAQVRSWLPFVAPSAWILLYCCPEWSVG